MMRPTQRANGILVLEKVVSRAHHRGWSEPVAKLTARACIMCCLDESSLYNLGSYKVPGSIALPHDGMGSDHLSVGVFQQQVPMWGPVGVCQTVKPSTGLFLDEWERKGYARMGGMKLQNRIQGVQISFDSTGFNYWRQHVRSWRFLQKHWNGVWSHE